MILVSVGVNEYVLVVRVDETGADDLVRAGTDARNALPDPGIPLRSEIWP